MPPQKNLTLYHYYRSSCSWRVRWAMALKGVPFNAVPVNLLAGEHTATGHLQRNPMGQVPSLQIGDEHFTESLAILEWLEETVPTPALLPADPLSRLRTRGLANLISAGTQPLQNLALQRYVSAQAEEQQAFARYWINRGLQAYEGMLLKYRLAGTYSMGSQVSMADLCLIPQCYNALRFGVDLAAAYPTIAGIYQRCLQTAACKSTAPEHYAPPATGRVEGQPGGNKQK